MGTKCCTECGRDLPEVAFNRSAITEGGRASHCKRCEVDRRHEQALEREREASRRWVRENPERAAFNGQRKSARERGVRFKLTFRQWLTFWSECFPRRGGGMDGLCMARVGDSGAYEVGNIYRTTNRCNLMLGRIRARENRQLHGIVRRLGEET